MTDQYLKHLLFVLYSVVVIHVVIGVVCQGVTICYGLQEDLCVLLGLTRHQVWPLTQFPFRQLCTIGWFEKGFLLQTHNQGLCQLFLTVSLGPLRLVWHTWLFFLWVWSSGSHVWGEVEGPRRARCQLKKPFEAPWPTRQDRRRREQNWIMFPRQRVMDWPSWHIYDFYTNIEIMKSS